MSKEADAFLPLSMNRLYIKHAGLASRAPPQKPAPPAANTPQNAKERCQQDRVTPWVPGYYQKVSRVQGKCDKEAMEKCLVCKENVRKKRWKKCLVCTEKQREDMRQWRTELSSGKTKKTKKKNNKRPAKEVV
jgi:hypothetical protein